jgi:hypothetical protein
MVLDPDNRDVPWPDPAYIVLSSVRSLKLTGPAAIPIGHVDGGDRHVSRYTPRQWSCSHQEECP